MHALDLTLPSPAGNLALDESLLLEAEQHGAGEFLRFWMSPRPFVVIGVGARVQREVDLPACEARQIPVLRRCSGGGTVVQGPGCLNYSMILRIPKDGPISTIGGTNQYIMQQNAKVLSGVTNEDVRVEGHTDLAIHHRKVSGNAQRRLRRHLLFHGTFLLDFNLPLITELLPTPMLQPDYRQNRAHDSFLRNLGVPPEELKRTLIDAWDATESGEDIATCRVAELIKEKYERREWNFRR